MTMDSPKVRLQPKWMTIVGWVLTVLITLFFCLSVAYALTHAEAVKPQMEQFGWGNAKVGRYIPVIELACIALYVLPQSTVLGVVLLTGYLGGAIATHARINDPGWVMAFIVAIVAWFGVFFREPRIRALIPFRRR